MISERLKTSFTISYLVLMGYTCITLIEALRTNNLNSRHVMNIETTVSIVAGIVYSMFLDMINKNPNIDLHDITKLRYIDWAITTPLILLVVLLFYSKDTVAPSYQTYFTIVLLNWGMLLFGYLGETNTIRPMHGLIIGFIFFALLIYMLLNCCIPNNASHVVIYFFIFIWSCYGFAYLMDEETKNLSYNILDVISKAVFGIVLYFYYGKVLRF